MRIWIDADALPRPVKAIILRAAERTGTPVTMVANKRLWTEGRSDVSMVTVAKNPDEADDHIAGNVSADDLVVTSDIPLADRVVSQGASALSPYGMLYDAANIKSRLATRNLLDQLRSEGAVNGGGPPPFSPRDAQAFANQLDKLLTAGIKKEAQLRLKRE